MGKIGSIGANFTNTNLFAILRNNYTNRDVLYSFSRGITTVLTASSQIEGQISICGTFVKSGTFYGFGLGGILSYSWPPAAYTMKKFFSQAFAIHELLPVGAIAPPGFKDPGWKLVR